MTLKKGLWLNIELLKYLKGDDSEIERELIDRHNWTIFRNAEHVNTYKLFNDVCCKEVIDGLKFEIYPNDTWVTWRIIFQLYDYDKDETLVTYVHNLTGE